MLKQLIYVPLLFNILSSSLQAMELFNLATDTVVVQAIESSSPAWVEEALNARKVAIEVEFQKRLCKEHKSFKNMREDARTKRSSDIFVQSAAVLAHQSKLQRIFQDYEVAQAHFKNKEIPEYLTLARKVAKEPCEAKSDLLSKGLVTVVVAAVGSVATLAGENSSAKLALLAACVVGGYWGGKKIIDGLDYDEYVARQNRSRNAVVRLLQNRQGNVFEKLVYKLKNA